MSVLDAFLSTWSNARATFGEGVPQAGDAFDQSAPLSNLQSDLDRAAPGSHWSGGAAAAYGRANTEHQRVVGELGGLDRRLAAQVNQSAQIVTAGRQDLDAVRRWVLDAAASVPNTKTREQLLLPIVNRGLGQLGDIVARRNGELNTVGGNIAAIGGEYQALGNDQKFAPGDEAASQDGDDGEIAPEDTSAADQGKEDSEALQDGTLTDEQRQRLTENTTLSPEQQAALDGGSLRLPPEQMSYLQGFSQAFGNKSPSEIKAAMDDAGAEGGRVADVFQLASNPNIKTGLPATEPPSIEKPSSGGKYALPEGIQDVLDGPALTQPFSETIRDDTGNVIVHGEPTGPLQPTPGLNDLADIVQQGDRGLQAGTELDSGLLSQGQEMLAQANRLPIEQAPGPGFGPLDDGPRWYHENVDPTLQNMFNAVNKDDMVIHDALVGPEGRDFFGDLTKHQWQDDGLAAGGLFDWVAESAQNDLTGRAASTAHALADYTSANQPELLNLPGTEGQSLGQVNPELTRDLSRAFGPYLDDMVGYGTGDTNSDFFDPLDGVDEQPLNTRALMSVMYTDHEAAEIMYGQAGATIEEYIEKAATSVVDQNHVHDSVAMQAAGRLQSALDLGSFDEAYDRLQDDQRAVHDSYNRRELLFDSLSGLSGTAPVAGGATAMLSPYLKDVFLGVPPGETALTPTEAPHSAFPVQVKMVEALLPHEVGNPVTRDWLQQQLGGNAHFDVPNSKADASDFWVFSNNVTTLLDEIPHAAGLVDAYWDSYSSAYMGAQPRIG